MPYVSHTTHGLMYIDYIIYVCIQRCQPKGLCVLGGGGGLGASDRMVKVSR